MKISEEYMERPPDAVAPAPVASILRKVAEQFRAGHPGADEGTVRERLSEFIRHEGWGEIDEATMSEALKPRAT